MKIANAKIEANAKTENTSQVSAWSPLRRPMFRFFWTAGIFSFWSLMQDPSNQSRFAELFQTESWAEHLRQHEHFSQADLEIEEFARRFHVGDKPKLRILLMIEETFQRL